MAGGSTSAAAPVAAPCAAAAHPLAAAGLALTAAASAAAFAPPPPIVPPLTSTAADQQMQAFLAAAIPPDLTPPWTDPTPPFQRPDLQQDPLVQLLAESRRTNQLLEQVVALLQGPRQADPLQQTPAPLTGNGAGPRMAAMLQDLQARRANRQTLSEEAHSVCLRSQPEFKLIYHLQHLYD
jgi:hypothetical protein